MIIVNHRRRSMIQTEEDQDSTEEDQDNIFVIFLLSILLLFAIL